ncbi:hypothetical protein PMAC_001362 [Pneumocystis sp. 'macacae']|nr:hypothetical protein PMAC_001362 [Pneumocystis sp. 'macacae']
MTPFKNTNTFKSRFLSQNNDYSTFFDQESNTSRFHKFQTTEKKINNHFSKNHNKIITQEFSNREKIPEEELIIRLTTLPKSLHSSTSSSPSFLAHTPSNDIKRLKNACKSSMSSQKQQESNSFLPLSYTLYNKSEFSKNENAKTISPDTETCRNLKNFKENVSIKSPSSSEYFVKLSNNISPIYPPSDHIENYIPLPDLMSDSRASTSSSEESEIKLIHSTPLCKIATEQPGHVIKKKKDSSYDVLEEIIQYNENSKHEISDTELDVVSKNIFCEKSDNTRINSLYKNNNIDENIPCFSEHKKLSNIDDLTIDKTIKLFGPGAWKTTPQSRPYIKTLSNSHISEKQNKYSGILQTQNENHKLTKMLLLLQEELKSTIINVEELELKIQKFEEEFKDRILPIPKTYSELPLYQTWPT